MADDRRHEISSWSFSDTDIVLLVSGIACLMLCIVVTGTRLGMRSQLDAMRDDHQRQFASLEKQLRDLRCDSSTSKNNIGFTPGASTLVGDGQDGFTKKNLVSGTGLTIIERDAVPLQRVADTIDMTPRGGGGFINAGFTLVGSGGAIISDKIPMGGSRSKKEK